jgi:hypothetical protein
LTDSWGLRQKYGSEVKMFKPKSVSSGEVSFSGREEMKEQTTKKSSNITLCLKDKSYFKNHYQRLDPLMQNKSEMPYETLSSRNTDSFTSFSNLQWSGSSNPVMYIGSENPISNQYS